MPTKSNPLKLNPLQLRTLALFQEFGRQPQLAMRNESTGEIVIGHIPHPHGDHFHVGHQLVMARDATGLTNPSVWAALERKGLAYGSFPHSVTLTEAGASYETGIESEIFHGSDH